MIDLADTSAWTNSAKTERTAREFADRVRRGEIVTCDPVKFELLRSEPDAAAVATRRSDLDALSTVSVGPPVWQRALDVLELLAARGPLHHREVPLPDLLVAAAAERAGVPVLHYDRHFDVLASVTGQPVRAIAPLGSL